MTAAAASDPALAPARARGPVPLRPLRLAELLDAPFALLQADLRAIVLAAGLVVVPTQIIVTVLQARFTSDLLASPLAFGPGWFDFFVDRTADALPGFVLVSLVSEFLLLLVTAAVTRIGAARYWGRSEDARTALAAVGRRALPLAASRILAYVAAGGGFLLALAVGALGAAGGVPAVAAVGFVLAVPLAVVGIYLYIAFTLSVPALVLEEVGPVRALRRSFGLVRGRWWPVFGILVLSAVVIFIVGSALGSIPSILASLVSEEWYGWVFAGAGAILVSILVEPLLALVILLLYADLRIRKEGLDLELAEVSEGTVRAPGIPPLWAPGVTTG